MWELCKIANGNLSCDNGNMRSEEIPGVLKVFVHGEALKLEKMKNEN